MEILEVTLGNTVDFIVDVEGLSPTPSMAKLEIYGSKVYAEGLTNKLLTVEPVSIVGTTISFVFDTDTIATTCSVLYGRFYVLDDSRKINSYFKLKFTY